MNEKQIESNFGRWTTGRHLFQLCLLPLCVALVAVGCRQEAKIAADTKPVAAAPAVSSPVGTYALATVDGNKVPCTVQHEGHTMTISSGSFTINADGTCSSKMSLAGRDAAIEVKAAYTLDGSKLTMTWQGAGMTTGTVEGNTFTMNNEGMVLAYRK